MNWVQYWPLLEVSLIIGVFTIIIWRLWRSAKKRAQSGHVQRPTTLGGKIRFAGLYVARLLGVGIGAFFAIALVVMIERNILSAIMESAPAPSQVEIPANLSFEVEEITFLSEDGLRMAGWYAPPENGALVILLHG